MNIVAFGLASAARQGLRFFLVVAVPAVLGAPVETLICRHAYLATSLGPVLVAAVVVAAVRCWVGPGKRPAAMAEPCSSRSVRQENGNRHVPHHLPGDIPEPEFANARVAVRARVQQVHPGLRDPVQDHVAGESFGPADRFRPCRDAGGNLSAIGVGPTSPEHLLALPGSHWLPAHGMIGTGRGRTGIRDARAIGAGVDPARGLAVGAGVNVGEDLGIACG